MLGNRPLATQPIAFPDWPLAGPYEPDSVDISIALPIDIVHLVVIDPIVPGLGS